VTVTLPVDTTPPAAPVVSVTGTTSSTVGLAWGLVADDDYTCCTYRVFANGAPVLTQSTGERAVTVLRLAAATTYSFGAQTDIDRWITYGTQTMNTYSVQAIDSAGNRSPTSSVTLTNQTC